VTTQWAKFRKAYTVKWVVLVIEMFFSIKKILTISFSFFVPTTFSFSLYREFRLVGIERHVLYFACYLSGMSGLKWNGSEPV
jgi:hypothetical protein